MKKKVYYFLILFLLNVGIVLSQTQVTGIVVDESGAPVIGATVQIKGTGQGTITDYNGNFTLNVPSGYNTLVISYVGMKSQELIASSNMRIILQQDAEILDEIVVVGYGTQAKKDLTGSVGVVSQTKMENQAVQGIGQNLQGKLAGVQIYQNNGTPYSGTTIRIRGNGSFGANNNPLIVIDGLITNDGLSNLNPNDVENITILKDAASSAIYGSRGANGVVIITTKKGNFEAPMKISVSGYGAVDNIRHKIPTLTAKEYATMVNDYYAAANLPIPFSQQEVSSYGAGTNWVDEISQSGYKQNYSLNITGGTKTNAYAVSASFYTGEGVIKNTTFNRANVKLSNDMLILPNLKFGLNLSINYGVSNNTDWGQAIDRAMIYPPTVPAYDENGNYGVSSHHGEPITMLQPLIAVNLWRYDQNWKKLIGITYLDWEIIKGLNFKTSFNTEYFTWDQDNFIPAYSYGPKGLISDHPIAVLNVDNNQNINYTIDNILTYTTKINSVHNLTAMAGYTFQEANSRNMWATRNNFLNNDKNMQVLNAGSNHLGLFNRTLVE